MSSHQLPGVCPVDDSAEYAESWRVAESKREERSSFSFFEFYDDDHRAHYGESLALMNPSLGPLKLCDPPMSGGSPGSHNTCDFFVVKSKARVGG